MKDTIVLRAMSKEYSKVKTERKEFSVPYFEPLFKSPVFITDNVDGAVNFFKHFNRLMDNIQIGIEINPETSIDSDKEWNDKDEQIDRTMSQLGRLSKLSNEDLKAKVESLEKHRKRIP